MACEDKGREPVPVDAEPTVPSPFRSPADCERIVAARDTPSRGALKVGTWNIRWFPRGQASSGGTGTDIEWLACLIDHLEVDVLAVQEFIQDHQGRNATINLLERLGARTGSRWSSAFDDCPDDDRQHVGVLWNESRVAIETVRTVAEMNPLSGPCASRLRPAIDAYVEPRQGPDLHLVVVHFDSGVQRRDRDNRLVSVERTTSILPAIMERPGDRDLLLVGDFNTMGCVQCSPRQSATEELEQVTAGLGVGRAPLQRIAPNHRCTEYYRRNPVALDHAFVSRALGDSARPVANVYGPCAELACGRLKGYESYEATISDHCPIVIELGAPGAPPP